MAHSTRREQAERNFFVHGQHLFASDHDHLYFPRAMRTRWVGRPGPPTVDGNFCVLFDEECEGDFLNCHKCVDSCRLAGNCPIIGFASATQQLLGFYGLQSSKSLFQGIRFQHSSWTEMMSGLSRPHKLLHKPLPCIASFPRTLFAPPILPVRIIVFPLDPYIFASLKISHYIQPSLSGLTSHIVTVELVFRWLVPSHIDFPGKARALCTAASIEGDRSQFMKHEESQDYARW